MCIRDRVETHEPVNLGKIAAFVIGAINVIIGAVALARTGFDAPTSETTTVAGLRMTALLALSHLILGALTLAGATSTLLAKSTLATTGAILVIAGIIALIEPIEALGWNTTNGVVYLVLGAAALIAGMLTTERGLYHRRVVDESDRHVHVD